MTFQEYLLEKACLIRENRGYINDFCREDKGFSTLSKKKPSAGRKYQWEKET